MTVLSSVDVTSLCFAEEGNMETRAKKKTYNIIMVALIVLIVVCGLLFVGHIQGWFKSGTNGSDLEIISEGITGVANIERSDIGYSLEKEIELQPGDIVETKNGSEAVFAMGKSTLSLGENSEMEFPQCADGIVELQLNEGLLFAEVSDAPKECSVRFDKNTAIITGTVFSVSQYKNSSTLTVYEGTVEVAAEDGSTNTVKSGQQILIAKNDKDKITVDTSECKAASLSDSLIEKLLACETDGLCFDEKKLKQVTSDREKEKKAAAEALEQEAIAIAAAEEAESSAQASGSSNSDVSSGGSGGSSAVSGGSSNVKVCTISIRCKSILKNMDKLKEGKNRYVPSNGVILATSSVEFRDGETAYDVTKRACSATGIQIEASYSPVYGSYYVEGINHLYEFDCGDMSGWLYRVNGWTPNYGCSEYKLKNGDSIVWDYTCTGN